MTDRLYLSDAALLDFDATVVAVGSALDMVDGDLARLQGTVSRRGAFLDSSLDRLAESMLLTAAGGYEMFNVLKVGGVTVGATTFYPVIAAPLILVGTMMIGGLRHVAWDDPTEGIPAFLTVILMPLATSITEGVFADADSDRLQQAVGNLLSNAARYTPAGGRVDVSLRREAGQAVIEVADTGMGISDEDMDRVFSRFWRADSARAAQTGGIGIGLSVTKEIVERHHGSIGVASRPGGGTTFTIRLPLSASNAV